jgi:hypothetical protein
MLPLLRELNCCFKFSEDIAGALEFTLASIVLFLDLAAKLCEGFEILVISEVAVS